MAEIVLVFVVAEVAALANARAGDEVGAGAEVGVGELSSGRTRASLFMRLKVYFVF